MTYTVTATCLTFQKVRHTYNIDKGNSICIYLCVCVYMYIDMHINTQYKDTDTRLKKKLYM